MTHKYKKNPSVQIALIPGVGRLSSVMILEGEQFEKFTRPEFGTILVPLEEAPAVATTVTEVAPLPVSPPSIAASDDVIGRDASEVVPSVFSRTEISETLPAAPPADEAPPADKSGEAEVLEEADVEEITSAILDDMDQRRLRKLAKAHSIELPKKLKTVEQIREHLRSALFPEE